MIDNWDKFMELVEEHFNKCDKYACVECSGLLIYSYSFYSGKAGKA